MNGVEVRELTCKERDAALALFVFGERRIAVPSTKQRSAEVEASKKTGPVFETVKYLNKNAERIRAGRLTRMDAIRALEAKGVSPATASSTALKWTREAGVTWAKAARSRKKAS
jgi:hypothetical protein